MAVNTSPVSAGRALDILRAGWKAQNTGGLRTSWMLHGRPGVGKTQIVTQLAEEAGAHLIDLRLTTIEPQDLRGLPYYDHDEKRTIWYRPEDLPQEETPPTVLFLDELTAASPALQPTVYGLLQERRVGRHELPANTFLVAAGNTTEDGAVAYEMGTGLSDRMVHLSVQAEAADWLKNYAVPRGLHPAVTAFIQTRPDLLETTTAVLAGGQMIAATPRSWERASQILKAVPDRALARPMLAGTLGDGVAAEFISAADTIAAKVRVAEMLELDRADRWQHYPDTLYGLYALTHGLVGALTPESTDAVIATMLGIRQLAQRRDEPAFGRMPLAELSTQGFESLIAKAFDLGLEEAFLQNTEYAAYSAEREALGLG
ncbi:MAG: MoxR family ATPase [Pseudomonadota bacterium]